MLNIKTFRTKGKLVHAGVVTGDVDYTDRTIENRGDWKTFEAAKEVAEVLGPKYLATDAGPNVYPRYDVIKVPQVGDVVSYGFNGDYYPCGKVKSVSKSLKKIVTVEENGAEHVFWKRGNRGSWVMNGTWSLICGYHDERNPSF